MRRGLTLVEVMLSLVILGLGVIAGVELMARVVAAQTSQNAWSQWEPRLMQARERLSAMNYDDVAAQTSGVGSINMNDLGVEVTTGDEAANPYPTQAKGLIINIKDSAGGTLASFPTLKIKETP